MRNQNINILINVEYPVKTTKGTFFFVQNTEAPSINREHTTVSNLKPFSGSAGKSTGIIIHDTVLDLYVEFKSKNKVGLFYGVYLK